MPPTRAPCTDTVDDFLPQVDLTNASKCNCGRVPNAPFCIVSFSTHRVPVESEDEENEESDSDSGEESSEDGDEQGEDEEEVTTYAEKFKVVGSSYERRYQQALSICSFLKSQKKEPHLDVVHEPDNVKDKNAIYFQVKHLGKCYIMGYCPLYKVPKLLRALKREEILSMTLLELKRKWMPQEKEYKLFATLSVLKQGKWDKDDSDNKYNSCIDV